MKGYEYQSEFAKKYVAQGREAGREEGRAEQAARALLTVLRVRGLAVSEAMCARIAAQRELGSLERWLEKATIATSLEEVFDEPS